MGRDKGGYTYYEPARESGIRPQGTYRDEYDGPIAYGGNDEDQYIRPTLNEPQPQPAGYFPAQPVGYAYAAPQPMTTPYMHPLSMAPQGGMMPGMMPSPGGAWYGAAGSPMSPPGNPAAAFAPHGAKIAGVKTCTADDRPPALMINPPIASSKATLHTQLQVRWDLRARPVLENLDSNGGAIPDLSQPATNPPTRAMYIVAEELPWAISIKRYNIITCQDVLDNIYKALQEPVKRDEFFAANPKKRAQVTKVALREAEDPESGREMVYNETKDIARPPDPLRIDWLDALTDFRGLYIDDKILRERCTWQIDDLQDAWVLDLGLNGDH